MTDDKLKRLALLEKKLELQDGLPYLHGWKWYPWAKKFFDSTNHFNLLVAANQIGKSSAQIRKCIHWATDQTLWPKLWARRPLQIWYLYPTREVATIEVDRKWIPEFLPRGKFKDDPIYGWRVEYKNKYVWALHFNSGVSVYFKTYATDVQHLQTGTVWSIFADEELPEELYDELQFRLAATEGYFHIVFTATLGQTFWREVLEGKKFPDAFKQQVSMYDCLHYTDGTKSHWSPERIQRVKNTCKSEAEILRRVYGKFIVDSGLKYPSFDRTKNVKPHHMLPKDWLIYAGVDVGSGGDKGHPAAIVFVGVSPDMRLARVFKGWRGDGVLTTASDVVQKYTELKGNMTVTAAYYDWASKDFHTIAARMGEAFQPAQKSHESGEQILNVLFKNEMLAIYDTEELFPLIEELQNLLRDTVKNKAKDDMADALRYALTRIPFDWSAISKDDKAPAVLQQVSEIEDRRSQMVDEEEIDLTASVEDEISFWNGLHEI
jgi:hypothetical protein